MKLLLLKVLLPLWLAPSSYQVDITFSHEVSNSFFPVGENPTEPLVLNDTCQQRSSLLVAEETDCFSSNLVRIAISRNESLLEADHLYYYVFVRKTTQNIEAISSKSVFWIADSGHFVIMEVGLNSGVNPNQIISREYSSLSQFIQRFRSLDGCNFIDTTGISIRIPLCDRVDTTISNSLEDAYSRISDHDPAESFSVVPNPSSGRILTLINPSPTEGLYDISMYDSGGRMVKRSIVQKLKPQTVLDAGELASGLYVIQIISPSQEVFHLKVSLQ